MGKKDDDSDDEISKTMDYHERMQQRHEHLAERAFNVAKKSGTKSDQEDHEIAAQAHNHAWDLLDQSLGGHAVSAAEIADHLSKKLNVGDDPERDINPKTGKFKQPKPFKSSVRDDIQHAEERSIIQRRLETAIKTRDAEAIKEARADMEEHDKKKGE